jgi:anthranilate phosphoribosyltransferase
VRRFINPEFWCTPTAGNCWRNYHTRISAQLFTTIIAGKGTEAQNNVVYANAGMAIATAMVARLCPVLKWLKKAYHLIRTQKN